MTFPIAEAQLTALFLQSIAYGLHVVTFTACMCVWISRPRMSVTGRWPWMAVAVALFLIGTIDVSFNFYHNLVAFIFYTGPGGPTAEFEDLSSWVNVIRVSRNFVARSTGYNLISERSECLVCAASFNFRRVIGEFDECIAHAAG